MKHSSDQEACVAIRLVAKANQIVDYTANVVVPVKHLDEIKGAGRSDFIGALLDEKVTKISMVKLDLLGAGLEILSNEAVATLVTEGDWWPTHHCSKTPEGKWQLVESTRKKMIIIDDEGNTSD